MVHNPCYHTIVIEVYCTRYEMKRICFRWNHSQNWIYCEHRINVINFDSKNSFNLLLLFALNWKRNLFPKELYKWIFYEPKDRAERLDIWSQFLLVYSPFLLPSFFRRDEKEEKNNHSRCQKSCLSVWSNQSHVIDS